ncbi:MAG: copper chaperone PCu(A)C [Proteobacteria bacterium]|nr:copper chaperone PCu(A)C [Pseudomonadota bacterium]
MRHLPLALAGMSLASAAWAAGPIQVAHAWSRVTPSAASAGVVYLTVTDSGPPDTLLGVETPAASHAELHLSRMANGIMEMDAVHDLPVTPGKSLVFAPGGYHIMLTGLAHALDAGQRFPITLTFAHAGPVTVEVTVQPMSYMPPGDAMKM